MNIKGIWDEPNKPQVDHPKHYGGVDDPYEAIKVIEAWFCNFNLGNCLKYIRRAGQKSLSTYLEDLEKARFYLDREITNRKRIENESRDRS
jgi:Protein of unknwon function (DUF3310)